MKFEDGIKLDFDDVLIRPKRSTLSSRSGVDIRKEYEYLNAPVRELVVPVVAANMDTVGTMEMSDSLHDYNMQPCLHKSLKHTQFFSLLTQDLARKLLYHMF